MIKTLNESKLANIICESIPKWTKTQNSNVSTFLVSEIELIEDWRSLCVFLLQFTQFKINKGFKISRLGKSAFKSNAV